MQKQSYFAQSSNYWSSNDKKYDFFLLKGTFYTYTIAFLSHKLYFLCFVQGKETTEEEDEVAVGMEKGFMDEFFEQVCFCFFHV